MKRKLPIGLLVLILFIWSCSKVPVTGRRQFKLLPESQLSAMSLDQYKSFLSQSTVVAGTTESEEIKRVGVKMSAAVEQFLKDNKLGDEVKNYKWEFNLVKNDEQNAWCMPGGKIVFYTGIMPITKDDNGVAVVMGHEIAHAVAKHGNERLSQMLALQAGGIALDVALSSKPQETRNLFLTAYGVGANLGVILPYSRKHESEADKLGLIFMAMAGYDPHNAIAFWERMRDSSKGQAPPEFLSTHPANETRIDDIIKYMPKAMKYYKQQ